MYVQEWIVSAVAVEFRSEMPVMPMVVVVCMAESFPVSHCSVWKYVFFMPVMTMAPIMTRLSMVIRLVVVMIVLEMADMMSKCLKKGEIRIVVAFKTPFIL